MPIIEIQRVPGLPKQRVDAPAGVLFSEWLLEQNIHCDVRVKINGRELHDDDEVGFTIGEDDRIVIFDQPKGGGFLKGSAIILGMFTYKSDLKFLTKIMSSFYSQPSATGAGSKTSPNNTVKGQTNIARNGEARPDNFGLIRAYPDLIQESIFEYVSNQKNITEWMNFGLGKYDVTSVRYSESNLGSLAGASYRIYQPGENIALMNEGFTFDDVDGQELPGPNESEDFPVETATTTNVTSGSLLAGQAKVTIPINNDFAYFYDLTKPHSVSFVVNVTYNTVSGSVTKNITLYGDLISATTTNDGATINPKYFYNFTFGNLSGSDYNTTPADAVLNTTLFTLNDNQALTVGPFFAPVEGTELWVHFEAQLGDDSAIYSFTIRKVDEENNYIPGTEQTFSGSIINPKAPDVDSRYFTHKVIPNAGSGRYSVSLTKTNNSGNESTLKVEMIHIVRQRTNVVYLNDTLVTVTVQATERATSSRDRKYNALINRHVISYNTAIQAVDYTISPSRRFADIALHNWLIVGGQPETNIDIYGLYQIQAQIDAKNPFLGYFDYTFDDEDVSLGTRMETICNAAGVTAFWDDGVLSFTLDSKKDRPVTVFNRSNTTSANYSVTYEMTLPGGYDGVEVQYRNPTTNKQDYVRYRVREGQIEKGAATKAKKFEMLYIRNELQADYRAQVECRRLIYSRITMGITALADGEWVNVGDMVLVPDTYDSNQQAGYIVSRKGNDFETSERIDFSGNMYVVITDGSGDTTARYLATPRSDTAFGFSADLPNVSLNIFDGIDVQSPSRYVIATVEELDATLWTVSEKQPNSDGTTALTLAEYSDLIYP